MCLVLLTCLSFGKNNYIIKVNSGTFLDTIFCNVVFSFFAFSCALFFLHIGDILGQLYECFHH